MKKAMISKCMLGFACRYDGASKALPQNIIDHLSKNYRLYSFCPEAHTLPTPRIGARFMECQAIEVLEKKGKIINLEGEDVTEAFVSGAKEALRICKEEGITLFIGKEKSPSCGIKEMSAHIKGEEVKIKGEGITSALLKKEGIELLSEWEINNEC